VLTPELAEIAAAVDTARALPLPVAEVAQALLAAASSYPDDVHVTDRIDDSLGIPVVEVTPTDVATDSAAGSAREFAATIAGELSRHGIELERSRLLDIGFGSGGIAFALAGAGAQKVIGVDVEPSHYTSTLERERMLDLLASGSAERVELKLGDAHHLAFPDSSFDAVYSATALEHVEDAEAVLEETFRVLRPGGIAYHTVDPWFGIRGGHALCTLDFPWGHVRLTREEFEDYVRRWRPHEAEDAIAYRRHGFQRTPLPSRAFLASCRAVGFDVSSFRMTPLPMSNRHWRYLDREVLRDCRRVHPGVRPADLLALGYTVVLRRP
jgi:SAM-dependent methyltransferase